MRNKLVLAFCAVSLFAFTSMLAHAQSSNNDQRIVGTWEFSFEGVKYTYLFNSNGTYINSALPSAKAKYAKYHSDMLLEKKN